MERLPSSRILLLTFLTVLLKKKVPTSFVYFNVVEYLSNVIIADINAKRKRNFPTFPSTREYFFLPRCRRVKRTNYAEGYPGRHFLNFDTCDKLGAQVFTTIAGNLLRFSARLFSPGNEVNVGEQVCQRSVVYDAFRFTRMSSTPFIAVLEKKKKRKKTSPLLTLAREFLTLLQTDSCNYSPCM